MHFDIVTGRFEDLDHAQEKLALVASDRDLSWSQLKQEVERLSEILAALTLPCLLYTSPSPRD